MRRVPVSPQATVTLDGAGNGQVSLTPPAGTRWDLQLAAISTTGTAATPTCDLSLGSSSGPLTLIDSTTQGNSASSGKISATPLYAGTCVWASWSGADPGALATLQLYGSQTSGYRAGAR